jgi:hypothetical protein
MQKIPYTGVDYTKEAELLADEVRFFNFATLGLDNTMHVVHKADALRQYLMYTYGGLWLDMDILTVKPLSALGADADTDIGLSFTPFRNKRRGRGGYYSTGAVFASPQTDFYKALMRGLRGQYDPQDYQSLGPYLIRGMYPGIENIKKRHPALKVFNIPMGAFYPYHYRDLVSLYEQGDGNFTGPEVIGVHWYGGAVLSMQYMNRIQDGTLNRYKGVTIGRLIQKAVGA